MSFTVTPGYVFSAGETVTATKLNLDGSPTIADGQSYPFGIGTAAAPSISFSSSTSSAATGFFFANPGVGVSYLGLQSALFTNYLQIFNGDNTTGVGAISQIGLGYAGAAQYRHFIQTRHQSANPGTTGNSIAFWVNNSVATSASSAAGTGNILSLDVTSAGVAMLGTTTNNSAVAGYVGELIPGTLASGSATALSTTVGKNVTSISLTAGEWDVSGEVCFAVNGSTTVNYLQCAISTTSGAMPGVPSQQGTFIGQGTALGTTAADMSVNTPNVQVKLAITTTIYLVAQASFGTNTCSAYGDVRARRMR